MSRLITILHTPTSPKTWQGKNAVLAPSNPIWNPVSHLSCFCCARNIFKRPQSRFLIFYYDTHGHTLGTHAWRLQQLAQPRQQNLKLQQWLWPCPPAVTGRWDVCSPHCSLQCPRNAKACSTPPDTTASKGCDGQRTADITHLPVDNGEL